MGNIIKSIIPEYNIIFIYFISYFNSFTQIFSIKSRGCNINIKMRLHKNIKKYMVWLLQGHKIPYVKSRKSFFKISKELSEMPPQSKVSKWKIQLTDVVSKN